MPFEKKSKSMVKMSNHKSPVKQIALKTKASAEGARMFIPRMGYPNQHLCFKTKAARKTLEYLYPAWGTPTNICALKQK
jgi:hypothetical protein